MRSKRDCSRKTDRSSPWAIDMTREIVHLPVLAGQTLRSHISYSELRLFDQCQYKWHLSKVQDKALEERALAMEFGTAMHAAMELMWGSSEMPNQSEIEQRFFSSFEENCVGLQLSQQEARERDRLIVVAPKMLSDARACPELQGIKPLAAELDLMEPIQRTDGLDVKFKGFVDFVYTKQLARKRVVYVADFKTCAWGWPAKKAMDPLVQAQVLLYKHFLCKLLDAEPRDVTAAFILLKKSPPVGVSSVELLRVGGGPKAMQRALDFMQSSITAMHSGLYERNRRECVRGWTDRETGEETVVRCPFLGSDCPDPSG